MATVILALKPVPALAFDTARIMRMIAWKLVSRGFDLRALVRSLSLAKSGT